MAMTTATLAAPRARPTAEPGLFRLWIARLLVLLLAANGLYMLIDAAGWYQSVPGVTVTGPMNQHFVGDVGVAFLAAAGALFAGSLRPALLAALALPAAIFLLGHALLHLIGFGIHAENGGTLATDLAAIHLPALLALWLALPAPPRGVVRAALSGRMVEAMIRWAEAKLGVTLDYAREIAANAPAMFRLIGRVSALDHARRPREPHAAHLAALGAATHDDCGTCVQIHINLARADGVAEDMLRRAVTGEAATLPAPFADSFRFGAAAAANDPAMHDLRERLVQSLGKEAVIELGVSIAFARFYTVLNRALGHARSCAVLRFDFGGAKAHGHG
jgi:AhpD family alkylhydroperoxidase